LTKKTLMAYICLHYTHKAPTCLAYLHLQLASKLELNLNIGQTNWDILGLSYKLKPLYPGIKWEGFQGSKAYYPSIYMETHNPLLPQCHPAWLHAAYEITSAPSHSNKLAHTANPNTIPIHAAQLQTVS